MRKAPIGANTEHSSQAEQLRSSEDFLKVSEVAKILRTTHLTVLRYIHDKKLKAVRISERKILVPRDALTLFIEKSTM